MAIIALASVAGAGLLLKILSTLPKRHTSLEQLKSNQDADLVFLFRNEMLIDASSDGLDMIAGHNQTMSDFDATIHALSPHFPTLADVLKQVGTKRVRLNSLDGDPLSIEIDRAGENLRLKVVSTDAPTSSNAADIIDHDVRIAELNMLRELTQHTPQLIWHEAQNGRLIWANHAYLKFSDGLSAPTGNLGLTLPNVSVFPELHDCAAAKTPTVRRLSVTLPDKNAEHWFDVTSVAREDGFLHFATDANAAVRADQERRNFVQTLGKTFAQLSIGLAIFDKRRQLAMFNPALLDLTRVSAEFLSSRPTIDAVLDKLRESRVLPEPKNYPSWRDQFNALETGAKDGTYCEVWNLPDGQTYRVTGRPHPDGAFAFLFEDISAEVSLTRRFRSDIETGQAVLDTLTDAIAVFSNAGTLVMSNQAYGNLWSISQSSYLDRRELQTEIELWQNRCTPTRMWTEMRDFIHLPGSRKPWSDDAILDDGRHMRCHANPIAGGMTMVRFTFAPKMKPIIRKLTMPDTAIRSAKR